MSKFLVTGGAGFIGSHIVKELVSHEEQVRVVDNLSSGKLSNINDVLDKIDFINGDITDYEIAKKSVEGMEYIIHEAALPSVIMSIQNPIDTNRNIVTGTINIFDAAVRSKQIKRIVQASSSAVYGDSKEFPKQENMLPNPISPYAVAKLTQEYYGKAFYEVYGLEVISLRYFNVFGKNQSVDTDYAAVIPKFIQSIKNNERPTIYGDGLTSRDFIHVKNIVNANIAACFCQWNKDKSIVNVGCGETVNLNQLVKVINEELHRDLIPIYVKERVGDIKYSVSHIKTAQEVLNYKVEINFLEGIKDLLG